MSHFTPRARALCQTRTCDSRREPCVYLAVEYPDGFTDQDGTRTRRSTLCEDTLIALMRRQDLRVWRLFRVVPLKERRKSRGRRASVIADIVRTDINQKLFMGSTLSKRNVRSSYRTNRNRRHAAGNVASAVRAEPKRAGGSGTRC